MIAITPIHSPVPGRVIFLNGCLIKHLLSLPIPVPAND
jgi:hypothetical protein